MRAFERGRARLLAITGLAFAAALAPTADRSAQAAAARARPAPSVDRFLGVWIMPPGDDDTVPAQFKNTPWSPDPTKLFTPWGAQRSKEQQTYVTPGDCDPWGPLGGGGSIFPIEIAKTSTGLILAYEVTVLPRRIYLDGRKHPEDLDPRWMGHSIGHWEGDTLVVDTVGTNGRSRPLNGYIDGTVYQTPGAFAPRLPQSETLHVVERFRVVGGGNWLEADITVEDPKVYTAPIKQKRYWERRPDLDFQEYYCSDNRREDAEGQGVALAPPAR